MIKISKLFIIIVICSCFYISSCKKFPSEIKTPEVSELYGLASPVQLDTDISEIVLSDYFIDINKIDSVRLNNGIKYNWRKGSNIIKVEDSKSSKLLNKIQIFSDGFAYTIPVFKSKKINYTFEFVPDTVYSQVSIAGNFNNWNSTATPLNLEDGKWKAVIDVYPGKYQYQIVADEKWMLDPNNSDSVDNNIGGFNSTLLIGNSKYDDHPLLITRSFSSEKIIISHKQKLDQIIALWNNFELPVNVKDKQFEIYIPKQAKTVKRSHIRIWTCDENQHSNNIMIPLEFGKVIDNTSLLTRSDKEATIMYFMMVDRFANGDLTNDQKVQNKLVAEPANYYGGDLKGILDKLNQGYFDSLGINMLWLSPITQNPEEAFQEWPAPRRFYSGYHGYWPVTLTTVDHRFGDEKTLKELVETAHQKNKNIILDFVSNHVHEDNPLIKKHPSWQTPLELRDGTKNIRKWDDYRLTTWFDTFLPSLDYENPEVIDVMTDSALYWIKKFDLDGFRHDATKHIPESFWRTMTLKAKKEMIKRNDEGIFQIGETFGSRELIGNYVGTGLLDGQFDFNLYFDARSTFVDTNASFESLEQSLNESLKFYGDHHLMGNISGNHDMPRFISYAGGDLQFGEDGQTAGWERTITVKNAVGYERLKSLLAYTFTIPGIPVIYYGDEIGMPGAGDPDNRRPMKFGNLSENEFSVKKIVQQLTKLRSNRIELNYGDFVSLKVDKNIWAYARTYFGHSTLIILNKSSQTAELSLDIPSFLQIKKLISFDGKEEHKVKNDKVVITVPSNGFSILTN